MRNEDIVLDGAKVFWRTLLPRLKAERGLLGLSVVLAFLAALAGIHPLAVLPFWIVLVAAILNRGAPPVQTAPASVGAAVETKADPLAPLLDALDMPVLVVAADETVVFQNAAAEKAFGTIPQDSYLSARVRSPGILDMVRETIATGKVNQIEHAERLPSEAVYVVRVAPVDIGSDVSGRRIFLLTYRDISQARRIDRMRSDFVANASHELRTPLASLRGFIETLQGPARDDRKAQEKFFGIMHEQVTRMSRLVDDLLSLSRLELKSHIAPDDAVDLGPLLGHVRDSLAPLAGELDVTIALEVPETPVFVQGGSGRIGGGLRKPDRKRLQIRAGRQAGGCAADRREWSPGGGDGYRPRSGNTCRACPAHHRAFLPGQCRGEPVEERHRPGPCDRQAYPHASPRPPAHPFGGGEGHGLQGPLLTHDAALKCCAEKIMPHFQHVRLS